VKTGIIDYGAGNLRSVHKAVETLNFAAQIVHQPSELEAVDTLILPGVGAFGDCVENLQKQELWEPIRAWVKEGKPYLGICLGYQILFESSEESPGVDGLGVLGGSVVRFPKSDLKVPHMGWNEIQPVDPADPLWKGLPPHPHVYFVHSFYPKPDESEIVASTADYGLQFASSIRKGNVVATQFHPEKSQKLGLQILGNFLESTAAALTV
tara:strand:- start:3376 stop:4005 length:630 start_codon:yes stop_codon:yes gene_type:complete